MRLWSSVGLYVLLSLFLQTTLPVSGGGWADLTGSTDRPHIDLASVLGIEHDFSFPKPRRSASDLLFATEAHAAAPESESRPGGAQRVSELAEGHGENVSGGGGLAGTWRAVRATALVRRVFEVGYWVVGALKVLWSIPKAVIQGDSRALIESLGDLLSGNPATAAATEPNGSDTRSSSQELPTDPTRALRNAPADTTD